MASDCKADLEDVISESNQLLNLYATLPLHRNLRGFDLPMSYYRIHDLSK